VSLIQKTTAGNRLSGSSLSVGYATDEKCAHPISRPSTLVANFGGRSQHRVRGRRFHPFLQNASRYSVCSVPFQLKSCVLRWAFAIRSHWRCTPLLLQCDLTRSPKGGARSDAHQGRTPGRCGRLERHPISIRLEPEGITPRANVKPGAGSRGIAAAKETCLGTN